MIVKITGGEEATRTVEMTRDQIVLGKHSACDVVLPDRKVSRRHARLVVEGGNLFLEDLGSTNGTTLAGSTVTARAAVSPGDEIIIGPYRIHAELPKQPAEERTAMTVPPKGLASAPGAAPAPEPATPTPLAVDTSSQAKAPAMGRPLMAGGSLFGPLAPLMNDESVTEVMVNGPGEVFVERGASLQPVEVRFDSDEELRTLIEAIAHGVGRVIDDSQPMLDARLADGSRVNAILMPLAVRGPYLTIRRFPTNRLSAESLVGLGGLAQPMLDFLRAAVTARLNLLVSGGTGSGKTTLLNALCAFVGDGERVITIEDAAELRLPQRHVLPIETRPRDARGQGEITTRDLVRNALRMRPDRIIVGEVRGGEALDMLQAMNSGHEGSLATIHANSPREALSRLETLVLFAGSDLPLRAIREQIAGAIRLIVQTSRGRDGRRRVTSICELTGMEGDTFTTGEVFRWEADGDAGRYRATGYIPRCREKMVERGLKIDKGWFET
jgi:pilus assembly protein CpaF